MKDLDGDAAFEEKQRRMPPPTFKDDEDVTTTANSIKKAEGLTDGKMEEPFDPLVQAKIAPTVKYTLADSDDEENDTVETRRSVKQAEKYFQKRFFINKREKMDYEKGVLAGTIDPAVASFTEGSDTSITADASKTEAKENAKKAAALATAADKAEEKKDPEAAKEKKALKKQAEETAEAMDLPPELNPEMDLPPELNPNLMAQRNRVALVQNYKVADGNHAFADIN